MCGPTTTGFLARIGSTGFWPPTPQKLFPTTTTLAVAYHSRSSPVEFTTRTHGSRSKFALVRSVNRRFSFCSSLNDFGGSFGMPRNKNQKESRELGLEQLITGN